ncbi:UAA transporter [Myriangium duriaei CBS 260.36]|uniref:UAA transporter n=1 Tax=Myriangium duriaei CBS 260.36 TaxID=1168546 RepID=A0A9P4MSG8_9PEZI|nr:UAA transporter [Myriangium duriaei CBS 260.36]
MSELFGPLSIIALIFGGCCSNVFALEKLLKQVSDSGLIITFLQFVLAAGFSWPSQLPSATNSSKPSTKPPVPLWRWFVISAIFYAVNMLNNWAFAFNISVPVHIILRSFGSVWTMLAGYIRGKRYTAMQIFSVALLTAGVLFSAWADAESKGKDLSAHSESSMPDLIAGLTIILIAQILGAYMGVYVQDTYSAYTTTWQANLFWSHLLALPMFIPLGSELKRQYTALGNTAPFGSSTSFDRFPIFQKPENTSLPQTPEFLSRIPSGHLYLALNALTQLVCISGVNLLSSRSSAVTVTIVLNVRKLVSFLASTWLFGHSISGRMAIGAALVFGSGGLYGWETSWRIPKRRQREEESKKKPQ